MVSGGGWTIFQTHRERKRSHASANLTSDSESYLVLTPYVCRADKWGGDYATFPRGMYVDIHVKAIGGKASITPQGDANPTAIDPTMPSTRSPSTTFLSYFSHRFQRWDTHRTSAESFAQELHRMDIIRTLRREFFSLLDSRKITRPREAFNRWVFESRTFEDTKANKHETEENASYLEEPLIPHDPHRRSGLLHRELYKACHERSGIPPDLATMYTEQIASIMAQRANDEAVSLNTPSTIQALTRGMSQTPVRVSESVADAKVTIEYNGIQHEILPGHYQKLRVLFLNATRVAALSRHRMHEPVKEGGEPSTLEWVRNVLTEPIKEEETREFHTRLFTLLQRYENATGVRAGVGSGHHAATPPDILDVLHRRMGVNMECFASPINCHFPHYCSAFLDTDVYFGSVGSFFDLHPLEGSFEAGPPYVEELMEAMYSHICRILTSSAAPLSFCLVIPEWRTVPTAIIQHIDANREGYIRRVIVAPRDAHVYADGFQHCLRDAYFKPVHNTLVVVMQNNAGAVRWPATDDIEAEVLQVWANLAANVAENPLFVQGVKKTDTPKLHNTCANKEQLINADVPSHA